MNLTFVLWELAIPAIVTLGLALALPYIVAHSIVPIFGKTLFKTRWIRKQTENFLNLSSQPTISSSYRSSSLSIMSGRYSFDGILCLANETV